MHKAQPHTLQKLTGKQMQQVCTDARRSAGGLDNFTPEDFGHLSYDMYCWIAVKSLYTLLAQIDSDDRK